MFDKFTLYDTNNHISYNNNTKDVDIVKGQVRYGCKSELYSGCIKASDRRGLDAGDCINGLSCDGDACRSLDKKLRDALNSWLDEQGANGLYGITNVEEIDVNDYL